MNDTCDDIKIPDRNQNLQKSNAETGAWKYFNTYEKVDMKKRQKDVLKDEILSIAVRIAKAREAKKNMKYNAETGVLEGTWKVPEVENMNRHFEEGARYYRL